MPRDEIIRLMSVWTVPQDDISGHFNISQSRVSQITRKRKRDIKMNYQNIFKYTRVAVSGVIDVIAKAADGIFTAPEMVEVIENLADKIVDDLGRDDLKRLEAVTSEAEFKAVDFHPATLP